MEPYDDDEDTHFCIKCHLTISGLDNYIRHRQARCQTAPDKNEVSHELPSTPTTVSYPEILNADAFFNSLELQSSAKSNPRRTTPTLENVRRTRTSERRRRTRKVPPEEDFSPKEKLHEAGMSPGVSDLDDPTEHLCIPSLLGFSDLVSSSITKTTSAASTSKLSLQTVDQDSSKIESSTFSSKHDRVATFEILIEDAKQADVKRANESDHHRLFEDAILSDFEENTTLNESKDLSKYEFDYQQDGVSENELSDSNSPEEDSYSESDDAEGQKYPPRGHTGGKWKPGQGNLDGDIAQLQENDVESYDVHEEQPSPSHTSDKWKPSHLTQKAVEYETKNSSNSTSQPPPGHTRGKWVPGARADIGLGYWCNPCGRKLASRVVYIRHLHSRLHAKRSMREFDESPDSSRIADPLLTRTRPRRKPSKLIEEIESVDDSKKTRQRSKETLICEMCHARVKRTQVGKHLRSHYHCRVAGTKPYSPKERHFLFENMGYIVRQCSFQCSLCHFYCNTEDTFLLHWSSSLHATRVEQSSGRFRCHPCDYWSENNSSMKSHLLSPSHRDVAYMMNGSVPVVISRPRALPCSTCKRQFQYNLQLRLHARETGHEASATAIDEYQSRITCGICSQVFRSMASLQRHQITSHVAKNSEEATDNVPPAEPYFCSFCNLRFATANDAVLHRRTPSHKETRAKLSGDPKKVISRECPHCDSKQSNLASLKQHLLQEHRELCHKCPLCGEPFALSQDVARHTRNGNCLIEKDTNESDQALVKVEWACSTCSYYTAFEAEFMFHETLHVGPVKEVEEEAGASKAVEKYRCPVCDKILPKQTLRNHIRSHTGERPFPCSKCTALFSRRADLNAHKKVCTTSSIWPEESERQRQFVCSMCNSAFFTKHSLRQHMLRHEGKKYKCGLPGCPTVLRTATELRYHRTVVHENPVSDRRYACSDCSYVGKTKAQLRRHGMKHEETTSTREPQKYPCPYDGCGFQTKLTSHLRRHVRLHTGTKPYKCRHCTYASNNVENLRKHVLFTSCHPGKTIYECDFCEPQSTTKFCTNFSKELRAHLMEAHEDRFPSSNDASSYVNGIFGENKNANALRKTE